MKAHTANAQWQHGLENGGGNLKTGNGTVSSDYSFATRFNGSRAGTTPEELIAAAHAGCYSMYLSLLLGRHNYIADYIDAGSRVYLGEQDGAPAVVKIELSIEAAIPGIGEEEFLRLAEEAKENCPISKALAAVPEISMQAKLVK